MDEVTQGETVTSGRRKRQDQATPGLQNDELVPEAWNSSGQGRGFRKRHHAIQTMGNRAGTPRGCSHQNHTIPYLVCVGATAMSTLTPLDTTLIRDMTHTAWSPGPLCCTQ